MKLVRTTHFVICTNDLGRAGRNYRQPPRPNTTRTFDIRRSRRLAAPARMLLVVRGSGPRRPIMSLHNAKAAQANVSPPGLATTHTQWN
jgi:hypothetical protein